MSGYDLFLIFYCLFLLVMLTVLLIQYPPKLRKCLTDNLDYVKLEQMERELELGPWGDNYIPSTQGELESIFDAEQPLVMNHRLEKEPQRKPQCDCSICHGIGVIARLDGNEPCSKCGTTEKDIPWDRIRKEESRTDSREFLEKG